MIPKQHWAHILVTGSLLLLAMICYAIGTEQGMKLFFALGILFETIFWIRVLHNRPKRAQRLKALKSSN